MKKIFLTMMVVAAFAAVSAQAQIVVPIDYTHATGDPGPEPNSGDDSATTRLNDDVISTGSWSDGLHVSWGQGTIAATDPTATITFEFDSTYDFTSVDIYQYTTTWVRLTSEYPPARTI